MHVQSGNNCIYIRYETLTTVAEQILYFVTLSVFVMYSMLESRLFYQEHKIVLVNNFGFNCTSQTVLTSILYSVI